MRQLVNCCFWLVLVAGPGEIGRTYGILHFTPADILSRLELGRVVLEDTCLQNRRLSLGEVAEALACDQGSWVGRGLGEEGDEDQADDNGKEAFEKEQPLPPRETGNTSHVQTVDKVRKVSNKTVNMQNIHSISNET